MRLPTAQCPSRCEGTDGTDRHAKKAAVIVQAPSRRPGAPAGRFRGMDSFVACSNHVASYSASPDFFAIPLDEWRRLKTGDFFLREVNK